MSESNGIYGEINRRHIRLLRYLNDIWIFLDILRPELKTKATELRNSSHSGKRIYKVPDRNINVKSRRTDADLAAVFQAQHDRGIYEANIVSIISRIEAHLQDCMATVIKVYPEKLKILDQKGSIPLDTFLKGKTYGAVLDQHIASACQNLMFETPKEYLTKALKVLSIDIKPAYIDYYIEMKASRDIIVHGSGMINDIYVKKAGPKKRGDVGDELVIDSKYFKMVYVYAKLLSKTIDRSVKEKYGP